MEYSRFDDIASLLIDLCEPFSDDELIRLGEICNNMAHDKRAESQYTAAVKSLYVKNYKNLKNNSYTKRNFSEIDRELTEKIKNNAVDAAILPSYLKESANNASVVKLRAKIAKLKTN